MFCRRHLLQFAEGILDSHYEKLLQCDHRLNLLSKEGIMGGDSPCFDSCGALFQDQNGQSCYGTAREHKSHFFPHFNHSKNSYLPPFSSPLGTRTPMVSLPFSSLPGTGTSRVSPLVKFREPLEWDGRVLDAAPQGTPSPCSAMNSWATEESGISDSDDLHVKVTAKHDPMRFAAPYGGLGYQGSDLLAMKSSIDALISRTVSDLSQKKFSHNSVPTGKGTSQANNMISDNISHLWATEDSKINDADGLQVNVTSQCDQMIFAAPYSGLGNQGADFLSQKSMDSFVNRTDSRLSEKNLSHNSVPTDEETWQANSRILDDIEKQLLSDSFLSYASDEQNVTARIDSMYSLIQKDVSAANVLNGNIRSPENSGAAYGLGRLEKRVNDGQICERNGYTKEEVLRRDDRINSQVNVMSDGYLHCKGSTAIPRQDSLEDLLVNIPRIASFPRLFLDSSGEFITSVEPPERVGWDPFQ